MLLLHLSEDGHGLAGAPITQDLGLEGELVRLLAPFDRIELTVMLATPIQLRLLVKLLVDGLIRNDLRGRAWRLAWVDPGLEGELWILE